MRSILTKDRLFLAGVEMIILAFWEYPGCSTRGVEILACNPGFRASF